MRLRIVCGLGVCLMVSMARADMTFTDRNAFYTAVGGLGTILENWSELPNGTILSTYNGITYTPGTAGDQAITVSSLSYICNSCTEGLGGTQFGYFGPSETMTFTFHSPTTVFGIDINTFATGADYTLSTNTGSTAISGYDPFPGYATGEFVGLVSSTPFTTATITPAGNFAVDSYTLDNLVYTPEPSYFLLLGAVLPGLVLLRRHRRRQHSCVIICGLAALLMTARPGRSQTPPPPPQPTNPPPQNFCSGQTVNGSISVTWPSSPTEDDETPEGPPMCGEISDSIRIGGRERIDPADLEKAHVLGAGSNIPLWSYQTRSSRDGNVYMGTIVGGPPAGHATTNVPVQVIPVAWIFHTLAGTFTFDPTLPDPCSPVSQHTPALNAMLASPLFQPHNWVMGGTAIGNTTFPDAFQRAEFWNAGGSNPGYHTRLNVGVPFKITLNAYGAFWVSTAPCGFAAVVDYATWDAFFKTTLYPLMSGLGISTNTFPLMLFYNVFLQAPLNPGGGCCVLGYHSSFSRGGGLVQTYGETAFNTTGVFGTGARDVATATHEIGEWLNDPIGSNATPAWGHIGQVSGCQANLEVGDPLSGTLMPLITMNGFTYHLQELAFFNWFFGAPSFGVNAWYSSNGTFVNDAGAICQ